MTKYIVKKNIDYNKELNINLFNLFYVKNPTYYLNFTNLFFIKNYLIRRYNFCIVLD
jgi:hypothetical protein